MHHESCGEDTGEQAGGWMMEADVEVRWRASLRQPAAAEEIRWQFCAEEERVERVYRERGGR